MTLQAKLKPDCMPFPRLAGLEMNKSVDFVADRRLGLLSQNLGIMLLRVWLATYILWRQGLHLHPFHSHSVQCQQKTGSPEPYRHHCFIHFLDPMLH